MTDSTLEIAVVEVPAGTYPIGDDRFYMTRPEHTYKVEAFHLGQTTVTNQQFRAFIDAGGYKQKALWTEMGWRWLKKKKNNVEPGLWNDKRYNQPLQPAVGVTWYESLAFARWLAEASGLPWRLPTEVEWEAAARGEENEAPRPRNYNTSEREIGRAWPVTDKGNVSWCGAWDMAGNVWEWCNTRWGENWQTNSYPYPYNISDLREDTEGSFARIIRGGSWENPLNEAAPIFRARYLPGSRGSNVGFRLAR